MELYFSTAKTTDLIVVIIDEVKMDLLALKTFFVPNGRVETVGVPIAYNFF
jgi:hypothetical protein